MATYLDKVMMLTERSSGQRARLSTPNSLQVALASQLPANMRWGRGAQEPRQPPGVKSADATYENKQDLTLIFPVV